MTKTFEEKKKEVLEKTSMEFYGTKEATRPMQKLMNNLEEGGLLRPQQARPVVPKDVAKWIKDLKSKGYGPLKNPGTYSEAISDLSDELLGK